MSAAKTPEKKADEKESIMPVAVATPSGRAAVSRGKVYNNVLETIGGTPLVRVPKFIAKHGLECDVLAKLEFFNPMSSVKDRAALAIIEAAEKAKKIEPGKTTIIEGSSGNMAVSLAFIAAAKGYKIILVMPESVSLDRRKLLLLYGAEVVLTGAEKGMKGSMEVVQNLLKATRDSWTPDQFNNPNAPMAHVESTAEEIWADTGGKIDILITGVGSGATITGISEVLRKKNPNFKAFAVEPTESPVLSGGEPGQHKIQGIGAGFKPPLLGKSAIDGIIQITSKVALQTAQDVLRLEGISCGISTGANFAAVLEVAQVPETKGKTIVVMVPSSSERYSSTDLFKKLEN